MSNLRPIPKMCIVKSQSLYYLANNVPMNLRGWVALAESPHWFVRPNGPPKKTVQPSSSDADF